MKLVSNFTHPSDGIGFVIDGAMAARTCGSDFQLSAAFFSDLQNNRLLFV